MFSSSAFRIKRELGLSLVAREIRVRLRHGSADRLAPRVQHLTQLLHHAGLLGRQVVLLAEIGFQIEQLDGSVLEILQQFVIAVPNRTAGALHTVIAVMGEVPVERTLLDLPAFEQRQE